LFCFVATAKKLLLQTPSLGSHTTFLQAILKSSNRTSRIRGLSEDDLRFAKQHLDHHLFIDQLHYTLPDV
jgi:hypothetical protein